MFLLSLLGQLTELLLRSPYSLLLSLNRDDFINNGANGRWVVYLNFGFDSVDWIYDESGGRLGQIHVLFAQERLKLRYSLRELLYREVSRSKFHRQHLILLRCVVYGLFVFFFQVMQPFFDGAKRVVAPLLHEINRLSCRFELLIGVAFELL